MDPVTAYVLAWAAVMCCTILSLGAAIAAFIANVDKRELEDRATTLRAKDRVTIETSTEVDMNKVMEQYIKIRRLEHNVLHGSQAKET